MRGDQARRDNTDRDAAALAKELGDTDSIAKAIAEADDFSMVLKVQCSKEEMTAILTGKARHLVVQRMWKETDRDWAKLWVYSKDNMQQALVRVGTSVLVRLHTYDTWKKVITVTEQWACPRMFEREFRCEPTFENMAKHLGVEWYRGARAPLCKVIWPVTNLGALGKLLDMI